ncbi:hypothetical protein [Halomonas sp. M20]|uniref:hypothetical protein n=1 Tax=Halomonas sp. M20 TaxID=2763264 RepID=UPI001D0B4FF5|nr:hypothetical protein [Halomonas sp. M20]
MSILVLSRPRLLDVTTSLIADELKTLRRLGDHEIDTAGWNEKTRIHDLAEASAIQRKPHSLEVDFGEMVALVAQVNTYFQLTGDGVEDSLLRSKTLGEWVDLIAVARGSGTCNIALNTSGNTKALKVYVHQWHDLVEETAYFAQYLEDVLDDRVTRIVALAPRHSIYGLIFSVLLPEFRNVPVVSGDSALAMVRARKLQAGDVVVGDPLIWRQLSRQRLAFPNKVLGLTTAALNSIGLAEADVAGQLRQQNLSAMVEIYGSDETAGIGARIDTDECFRLLPRWRREDSYEAILRDDQQGRRYSLAETLDWLDHRRFSPLMA